MHKPSSLQSASNATLHAFVLATENEIASTCRQVLRAVK
jgi:hypothetical protein